ncbi:MAG: hypothetical protein LUO80_04570, partial [Methylococcaceae bacterium]|nr:hypothetical protein [Methylococcaceae bacterium]
MSKAMFTRGWTLVIGIILLAVTIFAPVESRPVSAQTAREAIASFRSNGETGDEIRLINPYGTEISQFAWQPGARGLVITPTLSILENRSPIVENRIYLPLLVKTLPCNVGAVQGKVFDDRNENGIDDNEGGVSGAVIGLYDLSDQLLNIPNNPKTTGADGQFRFDGLALGNYRVKETVIPPGGIATTPVNLTVNLLACQTAYVTFGVQVPPPDPITVAPDLDPSIVTSVISATQFLYTGSNPIQTG